VKEGLHLAFSEGYVPLKLNVASELEEVAADPHGTNL
jgi:hypothetical protein